MKLSSFLFFFLPSLAKAQIDTAHFVLVIFPFARDIRQKAVCNGVPVETAANMALLWGRSYRADNVMDHCLDRRGWGSGVRGGSSVVVVCGRREWERSGGGGGEAEGCRGEAQEREGGAAGRVMHMCTCKGRFWR